MIFFPILIIKSKHMLRYHITCFSAHNEACPFPTIRISKCTVDTPKFLILDIYRYSL